MSMRMKMWHEQETEISESFLGMLGNICIAYNWMPVKHV